MKSLSTDALPIVVLPAVVIFALPFNAALSICAFDASISVLPVTSATAIDTLLTASILAFPPTVSLSVTSRSFALKVKSLSTDALPIVVLPVVVILALPFNAALTIFVVAESIFVSPVTITLSAPLPIVVFFAVVIFALPPISAFSITAFAEFIDIFPSTSAFSIVISAVMFIGASSFLILLTIISPSTSAFVIFTESSEYISSEPPTAASLIIVSVPDPVATTSVSLIFVSAIFRVSPIPFM